MEKLEEPSKLRIKLENNVMLCRAVDLNGVVESPTKNLVCAIRETNGCDRVFVTHRISRSFHSCIPKLLRGGKSGILSERIWGRQGKMQQYKPKQFCRRSLLQSVGGHAEQMHSYLQFRCAHGTSLSCSISVVTSKVSGIPVENRDVFFLPLHPTLRQFCPRKQSIHC
jgi:hypothetical protein